MSWNWLDEVLADARTSIKRPKPNYAVGQCTRGLGAKPSQLVAIIAERRRCSVFAASNISRTTPDIGSQPMGNEYGASSTWLARVSFVFLWRVDPWQLVWFHCPSRAFRGSSQNCQLFLSHRRVQFSAIGTPRRTGLR